MRVDEQRNLVARLVVEDRACDAVPIRGSALGVVRGVAAHLGSGGESLHASWMPGRLAIVHAGDLSPSEVTELLSPGSNPPYAAVVLLADDSVDTTRFQQVAATVPVVIARRAADRPRIALATHVEVAVALGEPVSNIPLPRRDRISEFAGRVRETAIGAAGGWTSPGAVPTRAALSATAWPGR